MDIRVADTKDAYAVRSVGLRTWPVTYEPIAGAAYVAHGLARWWSLEAVRRGIERRGTFVAVAGDDVVGTATVGDLDGSPVLWKLYVLPELHGCGIGSALLGAVVESLPVDARRLQLPCANGNTRARRFYRRRGFVEVDRAKDVEGGPDIVWMALALNPIRSVD